MTQVGPRTNWKLARWSIIPNSHQHDHCAAQIAAWTIQLLSLPPVCLLSIPIWKVWYIFVVFICVYLYLYLYLYLFVCIVTDEKAGNGERMVPWVIGKGPGEATHWVFCCQHTTGFMNNSKTQRATHRHTHKQKLTQLSIRLAYNWIYTKTSLSSLSPAEASLEGILCLNAAPHMDQLNSRWWKNFI